ncbi:hypothetical protein Vadar_010938 [Vaccinium darrowii]|uniref:Uncharacterized protein n=1 Tax=Vaccinium darrowii TaxID=229202 RepID=A0ACB7WZS3_9ERIC|nr:hypothetical protein Vadar_010938 [Vaccinium darrowii]
MEHPQIHTLLVLIPHHLISFYDFQVVAAGIVCVGGAGGSAWTFVDGGRRDICFPGDLDDMDYCACAAYLL